ncbi:hypothetical protein M433DRAFT_9825 [Acidomyces richmondensis BFW]|nr:hypothetical protein M433DRAFT_9825 [Acidomyces richmondensis BFW]
MCASVSALIGTPYVMFLQGHRLNSKSPLPKLWHHQGRLVPLRYELAEIFLRSELDLWWPSRLQPPTSPSLLIFHPWQDYATYFTPEYEKHVKLHLTSASPDNTVLNAALDCIYHVLTRHMIEHALFGDMDYAKRIRLLDGLKIRQDRGLPPLTFDNAAAYNLCMTGRVGYSAREPGGNGRGRNLRSSS